MNLVIAGTTIIVARNVITFRERDEKERTNSETMFNTRVLHVLHRIQFLT